MQYHTVIPTPTSCVQDTANMQISLNLASLVTPVSNLDGLQLGHLLGKGAYGKVFDGTWLGTHVAIKVRVQTGF